MTPDAYCAVAIAVHGADSIEAFESCDDGSDQPLTPVPFADRVTSPLWESLVRRGEPHRRVLAPNQVRAIRAAYALGDTSTRKLAGKYGVSANVIWRIVSGTTCRDVTEEAA